MLNSNVRDPASFFLSPPMCFLTNTANLSIANDTWTLVTWNVEIVDSENHHSVLSATGQINVIRTGLYDLRAIAWFAFDVDGGRAIKIERVTSGGTRTVLLESGAYSAMGLPDAGAVNVETAVQLGDSGVFLDAGDYLEVYVRHTAGASLNLLFDGTTNQLTWFAMRWVAAS